MSKGIKHFKWGSFKRNYTEWWNNLSVDEKVEQKRLFELKRQANTKRKFPYPDIKDLTHLRISQLSDRHICRIHDFKDITPENIIK